MNADCLPRSTNGFLTKWEPDTSVYLLLGRRPRGGETKPEAHAERFGGTAGLRTALEGEPEVCVAGVYLMLVTGWISQIRAGADSF